MFLSRENELGRVPVPSASTPRDLRRAAPPSAMPPMQVGIPRNDSRLDDIPCCGQSCSTIFLLALSLFCISCGRSQRAAGSRSTTSARVRLCRSGCQTKRKSRCARTRSTRAASSSSRCVPSKLQPAPLCSTGRARHALAGGVTDRVALSAGCHDGGRIWSSMSLRRACASRAMASSWPPPGCTLPRLRSTSCRS